MLAAMMKFLDEYKVLEWIIGVLGIYATALIVERFKALFFEYSLNADVFMAKVFKLVEEDKADEAIALCGANQKKPLAYCMKRMLEKMDHDERTIEQALDIAASEVAPKLAKNLGYLQMVSNVVTLVGLLGTVIGLIMSFAALGSADPQQKSALLAAGISSAMNATAAGLCVAIPVMIFYSFLHAKQGRLFSEMDQYANKMAELLKNKDMKHFSAAVAFPGNLGLEKSDKRAPPTPPGKTA